MADKHTIHMDEGRVEIDGDDISVYMNEPIRFQRKHWVIPLSPQEEASRTFRCCGPEEKIKAMLAKAFSSARMVVYPED